VGTRKTGDLDFGPDAAQDFYYIEQRWFDYWLKGIDNGMMNEPAAEVFVTGTNLWRGEKVWPPSRAKEVKYYLRGAEAANSLFGKGRLSTAPPATEPTDQFAYDPDNPVPSYGGGVIMYPDCAGPRDRRAIERRDDVLVYATDPLERDTEVTGRILARLYAASSAKDTDFTATLVDVHPDGYAEVMNYGLTRARHRNSFKTQELITPGKVYEYTIDLWSVSHVFLKGHKILVEISSSNFPRYDRNPNTGHPMGEDAELQVATQTIYHNNQYSSYIVLPIVSP
jgi:putative CocE/NonD family hydrolase